MATGSAVNDWQAVDPGDWQDHAPQVQEGAFSRFFHSAVAAINPLPSIREYLDRPGELGKAADALKVLDSVHQRAAALPENKGKPVNQWKSPPLTESENNLVERGMSANLTSAEGQHPFLAPTVKAGQQAQSGDIAGGLGTLAGGYIAPAAAGVVASAVPEAAAAAFGTVKRAAANPISRELIGVVSPRAKNILSTVNRVQDALSKTADEYPPIYDEISKGLGGGAYRDLSAEAQHAIQSIAEKLDAPKVAPRTASSSAPLPEAASTPGLTVNELITKELEAKRGAAPIPAQAPVGAVQRPAPQEVTGVGVPLRPPLAQPTPITATPEAVSPTPAPTVSSTLAAPAPTAPTPIDAGNPIPEAYRSMESSGLQIPQEASARSGIANKLAEHLHKNGITTQELDIIDGNPEAMKLFWDNASQLPGLSKQSHYSASPATIAAAKVALKDLEGTKVVPATPEAAPAYLTNNPKALKAAKAMAKEVMKPVSVGDLMGATKKVRKVKE